MNGREIACKTSEGYWQALQNVFLLFLCNICEFFMLFSHLLMILEGLTQCGEASLGAKTFRNLDFREWGCRVFFAESHFR
jgi:hypothetical protein